MPKHLTSQYYVPVHVFCVDVCAVVVAIDELLKNSPQTVANNPGLCMLYILHVNAMLFFCMKIIQTVCIARSSKTDCSGLLGEQCKISRAFRSRQAGLHIGFFCFLFLFLFVCLLFFFFGFFFVISLVGCSYSFLFCFLCLFFTTSSVVFFLGFFLFLFLLLMKSSVPSCEERMIRIACFASRNLLLFVFA